MRLLLHFTGGPPTLEKIQVCDGDAEIIKSTICPGEDVIATQNIGKTGVCKGQVGLIKAISLPEIDADGIINPRSRCIDVEFFGVDGSIAVSLLDIKVIPKNPFPSKRGRPPLKMSGQDRPH